MKFSGHETFQVREGWLHKGLKLIFQKPQMMGDGFVSDHLGVGRSMAKSIRHWLIATKLAEPIPASAGNKRPVLQFTEFGELVWEHDPYFLELGTWWMLHINLVNNPEVSTSWAWFFNSFSHDRFGRSVCLESLRRHIEMARKRSPSMSTLERDLGCLLLSYARTIPAQDVDPEDGADSPFRELGLMNYFKSSGYYQVNQAAKEISSQLFGYAMSTAFDELGQSRKFADISIGDATRKSGGPGRVFCMTGESLFETVSRIESHEQDKISIAGMAGERVIRMSCLKPIEWAKQFYLNVAEGSYVA
jgi:hypothetical protein